MIHKSIELAVKYHQHQRYGNKPYLSHLFNVFVLSCEYTNNERILSASILHDTLEDTEINPNEIKEIDSQLFDICFLLSKNYNIENYYSNISENPEASFVKIADRVCNINESLKYNNKKMITKYFKEVSDYHRLNNQITSEIYQSEFVPLITKMRKNINNSQTAF